MNSRAFGPSRHLTAPRRAYPAGAGGGGPLADLLAQLTGAAPAAAPAPTASSACQCISPPVPCNLVAGFTGAYDPASNRLFERHLHAECRSHLYPAEQYDSADRLVQYQRGLLAAGGAAVDTPTSLPGSDDQRSYDLDLLGNWRSTAFTPACADPQAEQRLHNALNQITQVTRGGTTTPFAYDGADGHSNGNLADDGVRLYAYDALNRLRSVRRKGDGALIARYTYDAAGRRVRKEVFNGGLAGDLPDGTTDYVYAGGQCLEEVAGGETQRQYVWGGYVDELVQQRELSGGQVADLYPLSDLLYRTVAVTDAGCAVVAAYDTDAYGRTLMYNGPGPDGQWFTDDDQATDNPLCPYLFTGRRYDPETRLYYYRARYYAPEWGRFLSRDPIGYAGGMGLYEYVAGNPVVHVDPSGEYIILIGIAVMAAAVVFAHYEAHKAEQASLKGDVKGFNEALWWFRASLVTFGIGGGLVAAPAVLAAGGLAAGALGLAPGTLSYGAVSTLAFLGASGIEGTAIGAFTSGAFAYSQGGSAREVIQAAKEGGLEGGALAVIFSGAFSFLGFVGRALLRQLGRAPVFRPLPGQPLSLARRFKRMFVEDVTRFSGPVIMNRSPYGRLVRRIFSNVDWEVHHLALQQRFYRGSNLWFPQNSLELRGLQRLGDAGWNLLPIPRTLNRYLGNHPILTAAFAAGVYGSGSASVVAAYWASRRTLGRWVGEPVGEWLGSLIYND